jgi:SAM-dependent methyltransferase
MLAVARARLEGITNATILQADAQSHDFAPAAADGVYSRFGVMFFDDPQAAFANLRRALKPGGRLAFVCWRPLAQNAWMAAPLAAACAALGETPPAGVPDAPGPFAFADPQRIRTILASAGFAEIAVEAYDARMNGGPLEDAVAMALKVGPLGALVREQPNKAEPARAAVRAALAAFETPAGVLMPAAVWIVTAHA